MTQELKTRSRKDFYQKAGLILLTVMIAFFMVWLNTYQRSVKYFEEGEELLGKKKYLEAITSYETSAHAYTPWNPYVERSMEKLWEIGQMFEDQNKEPDYALIAYRSLRSSVYAIRSFYTPYKEWVPKCDERIQELVRQQKAKPDNSETTNFDSAIRTDNPQEQIKSLPEDVAPIEDAEREHSPAR